MKLTLWRLGTRALVGAGFPSAGGLAGGPKPDAGQTPGAAALARLEQQTQETVKKVLPAVVAVETAMKDGTLAKHYDPFASGVIITKDGLILSQYHVSHMLDRLDPNKSHKPGQRVKIRFHDGKEAEAELLGANRTYDISLLRLVKPGPYPYVPLDKTVAARPGDRILQLGHPFGYLRARPPV